MLSDEDRAILLAPCVCGHTINDHGSLIPCWLCEDEGGVCALSFEALLAERIGRIVGRSVTAALNEAADAIDAEMNSLDAIGHHSFATGCYRSARIVRARATST